MQDNTSDATFEILAREAGDALLVVRVLTGADRETATLQKYEIALASLGDWAVTRARSADVPMVRGRKTKSKTKVWSVTHVPTGRAIRKGISKRDALAALVRLAPIACPDEESARARRDEVLTAAVGQ